MTEKNTELDQIASEAAADKLLNPEVEQQTSEIAAINFEAEAADVIGFAVVNFTAIWPKLETVYTPDRVTQISKAAAKVMEKYGWTLGGMLGNPWVGLALAVSPVVVPTYRIVTEKAPEKAQGETVTAKTEMMAPVVDAADPASLHNKA